MQACDTEDRRVMFTVPIEPVSASRPRVGRFGVFYEDKYLGWLRAAPELIRAAAGDAAPFLGPVRVYVSIKCTRPKNTKLFSPGPDVDNYAKAVLDAVTHAKLWHDDMQVVALFIEKAWEQAGVPGSVGVEIVEIAGVEMRKGDFLERKPRPARERKPAKAATPADAVVGPAVVVSQTARAKKRKSRKRNV